MTSEQHNRYVAYSLLGYAGFQLFWLFVMVLWFVFIFGTIGPAPPALFLWLAGTMMFIFFSIFTVPSVVAGWAMIKRKPWARVAGIVAAALAAMSAPVGTAACVYSLWFWTSDRWKEVYDDVSERDRSMLGLNRAEDFQPADHLHDVVQRDWIKEPPDWR
jgi:hypothetical protein